ncbi:MAG TPA: hypothetical protein VG838_14815 [Opitutaceae bacterium]|nr:hypothetical protein [Opitutaceae bacterium]
MNLAKFHLVLATLAVAAGLGGCAAPEARIRKHPDIVAKLAPSQLDAIKRGEVQVGFDMDMVRLALGEPDQVKIRALTDGSNEVWGYATYESRDGQPLYRGLYHRLYLAGDPSHPFYLNYAGRQVHDRFRVVFKDAKVIAVEKGEGEAVASLSAGRR